jgi:hypothetical protein
MYQGSLVVAVPAAPLLGSSLGAAEYNKEPATNPKTTMDFSQLLLRVLQRSTDAGGGEAVIDFTASTQPS